MTTYERVLRSAGAYVAGEKGAAAVETAIWLIVLVVPMLSVVDIGLYAYQRMQLETSAQMAVDQGYILCSQTSTSPFLTNCSGLSSTMTSAAQSTSLSTNVTATPGEGDYCVQNNALTNSGCGATAHYLYVDVSYTYKPMFPGVTVTSLLSTSMTKRAWTRMG